MDKYFYSIEDNGSEKEIHISGNVYFNDSDETETDHRLAEWTGLYLSYDKLEELLDNDYEDSFFEYINERVNYISDITKEEAKENCETYWDGEPGTELDIKKVTKDTPCGYYWYE